MVLQMEAAPPPHACGARSARALGHRRNQLQNMISRCTKLTVQLRAIQPGLQQVALCQLCYHYRLRSAQLPRGLWECPFRLAAQMALPSPLLQLHQHRHGLQRPPAWWPAPPAPHAAERLSAAAKSAATAALNPQYCKHHLQHKIVHPPPLKSWRNAPLAVTF